MSTTITLNANKRAIVDSDYMDQHYSASGYVSLGPRRHLLVGFSALAQQYKKRRMLSIKVYMPYSGSRYSGHSPSFCSIAELREPWDAATVTYRTKPDFDFWRYMDSSTSGVLVEEIYTGSDRLFQYGASFADSSYDDFTFSSSPYIKLILDDSNDTFDLNKSVYTPETHSYVSCQKDLQLSVSLRQTIGSYEPLNVSSGVLRYRFDNGETTEMAASVETTGQRLSATLPLSQLPVFSHIYYQWEAVDEFGDVQTSDWMQLHRARLDITNVFPPDGYSMNRSEANIFEYSVESKTPVNDSIGVESAQLQWCELGSQQELNYIDFPEESTTLTVAANTFPAQGFEYRIIVVPTEGLTRTTSFITVSTVDAISSCIAISPINTVEDGSEPIILQWIHDISTGTAQTSADIETSTDGVDWLPLSQVIGDSQSYSIPSDTLAAGSVFWRVRTYNIDDVPGAWSSPVSFINVAAPAAPAISVDGSPFPLISWQAVGQQAYRLQVDNYDLGTHHGVSKSFRVPLLLADGTHVVRVQVQNIYGLWSTWGERSFGVLNSGGAPIAASVAGSLQAELSWLSPGEFDKYKVFRNGKQIAEVNERSFADIYSIGDNEYEIVGITPDYNYTRSNKLNSRISVEETMLLDVESGEWMSIELSDRSNTEQQYKLSRQASIVHYSGSKYPSVELSGFYDTVARYTTAFMAGEAAKRLRGLIGKRVLIKSREDWMVYGIILDMSETVGDFYSAFSFEIQRMEAEYDADD